MSAAVAEQRKWTPSEYLEMERLSSEKHELFDGEIFAMAGASHEHNLIVASLLGALTAVLRRKCLVYSSDIRLFIPASGLYTYADATVLCGEPQFHDGRRDTITNPHAIFEVLSKDTESYDRGDKFGHYRSVPSHKDYVLVSQTKVLLEHFVRQPDGTWLMHELHAGDALRLPCGEVAVDDLYLQVSLPTPPRR